MIAKRKYSSVVKLILITIGTSLIACTTHRFASGAKGAAPKSVKRLDEMVEIPEGEFEMGAPAAEPSEYPPHRVYISTFRIDPTEVTVSDYRSCLKAGACRDWALQDNDEFNAPELAVAGVSWFDADRFCTWVGKRLPTEAEWERSARFGHNRSYPWGESRRDEVHRYANLRGEKDGSLKVSPPKRYPKGSNLKKVYDLAGNLAEWVSDDFDGSYYHVSPRENPRGPEMGSGVKSVRGGSWGSAPYEARANARDSREPHISSEFVGFRCAL